MPMLTLPLPKFGFVVVTRAALAAGLALLFAHRLTPRERTRVGVALVTFGAATTIPAAWWVSRGRRRSRMSLAVESDANQDRAAS
jgi:hypothetical protein